MGESVSAACIKSYDKVMIKLRRALSPLRMPLFLFTIKGWFTDPCSDLLHKFFLSFQLFLILFHLFPHSWCGSIFCVLKTKQVYNTKKNSPKSKTKNNFCQFKSLIGHLRDENYHFNQIKEEENQESWGKKSLLLWYVMILFYIFRSKAINILQFEPADILI